MGADGDHPTLELRKVQLTGGSTFTVSLPKEWAREHGVEAGTEVGLQANGDGTLLVRADTTPADAADRRPTVDVDHHGTIPLDLVVRRLYLAGHSEFALVGERATSREGVRSVEAAADELLGLTVVAVHDDEVVVRNALDSEEVSLQQTLLQLTRVTCHGLEAAVDGALAADGEATGGVADRTAEVDRLFGVVQRSFRRSLEDVRAAERLGADRVTVFDCYRAATAIARAGRGAERVADVRNNRPPGEDQREALRQHLGDATEVLADATDCLLSSPSLDEVTTLIERSERLDGRAPPSARKDIEGDRSCPDTIAAVNRATDDVIESATTVAGIAAQRALRERHS